MIIFYPDTWEECDVVPEKNTDSLAHTVWESFETYTRDGKTYEKKKPKIGFVDFDKYKKSKRTL